jgi:dTDP-4-amino-4,6-dideoxygalactose transaminase
MTLKMNDFRADPEELVQSELAACERVIRSGWWILGEEVRCFENEWAYYVGAQHAVGVGNGMDAIEIGLRTLGVKEGDEIITTPMTAFATVLAIIRAGAIPVLADIDSGTAMLDPESVLRCISPRTRGVVLVHLYGQVGPADILADICDNLGIFLLEDCAQAHGAKLSGRPVGSFGQFAAWSFYPTKNLGGVGDAGALTTPQVELADKARILRNYGQDDRYHHPLVGLNSRLDEIQAAILRVRLGFLAKWIAARRRIAECYMNGIDNPLVRPLPSNGDEGRHVYHLFVVTTEHRELLQAHLGHAGIDSLSHYPVPVHFQKPCLSLKRDTQGLKIAEQHAKTCLSLPCHPALLEQDVEEVIEAVNCFAL